MSRRLVVVALVLAQLWGGAPAHADEITEARLAQLADDALDDPGSLNELRDVTAVDGRPVDMRALLEGDGTEVRARLEVLAEDELRAPALSADEARDAADAILAERRFDEASDVPRPLEGVIEWLGDRLEDVFGPVVGVIVDGWRAIVGIVPGGEVTVVVLLAALVLALLVVVVQRSARRRARVDFEHRAASGARLRPGDLEREADEAERVGDLKRALRLRFRAGLLRLEDRRIINTARFVTSAEVARRLDSPAFGDVARLFDEVVYGGRPVRPADLETTRQTFGRLLAEAGRR
ncbi:MAG: DUF4129 domain-containing protein [Actinomycetota bacterium]|nr:DUF4129 domain-containing protein [Actinomycetota bacterium]